MTSPQPEQPAQLTPEALAQVAAYAELPLATERAAALAAVLGGPLGVLRALTCDGYADVQPGTAYRLPPEP